MKKLMNWWPTIQIPISKKEQILKFTTRLLAYLALAYITNNLTHLFGDSYQMAVLEYWSVIGFEVLTTLLFITIGKTLYMVKPFNKVWVILPTVAMIIFMVIAVPLEYLFSFNSTKATSANDLKTNTTYVTYSPSCLYCQASHDALSNAVRAYNQVHDNKVIVVDIDKENELSNVMKQEITRKRSIVKYDKDGHVSTVNYTIGDANGPKSADAASIYNLLKG